MMSCLAVDGHSVHDARCGCVPSDRQRPGRRGILAGLAGLGAVGLLPAGSLAANPEFEALVVNCIDPRLTSAHFAYAEANGLRDKYSHFVIPGGPLSLVQERFGPWQQTFWDTLDITIRLHNIKKVVAVSHRDCGITRLVFGEASVTSRTNETAILASAMRDFRAAMAQRKPALGVVTGIMDLDGRVELVS